MISPTISLEYPQNSKEMALCLSVSCAILWFHSSSPIAGGNGGSPRSRTGYSGTPRFQYTCRLCRRSLKSNERRMIRRLLNRCVRPLPRLGGRCLRKRAIFVVALVVTIRVVLPEAVSLEEAVSRSMSASGKQTLSCQVTYLKCSCGKRYDRTGKRLRHNTTNLALCFC